MGRIGALMGSPLPQRARHKLTWRASVQQIKMRLYASHRVVPAAPPAPKSRKRSIGQISKTAHEQHVVLDDGFEKAPGRKHTRLVKEEPRGGPVSIRGDAHEGDTAEFPLYNR